MPQEKEKVKTGESRAPSLDQLVNATRRRRKKSDFQSSPSVETGQMSKKSSFPGLNAPIAKKTLSKNVMGLKFMQRAAAAAGAVAAPTSGPITQLSTATSSSLASSSGSGNDAKVGLTSSLYATAKAAALAASKGPSGAAVLSAKTVVTPRMNTWEILAAKARLEMGKKGADFAPGSGLVSKAGFRMSFGKEEKKKDNSAEQSSDATDAELAETFGLKSAKVAAKNNAKGKKRPSSGGVDGDEEDGGNKGVKRRKN